MFSKSLASFVKEQIKEGHNTGSIKKYLKNYGYHETEIEAAINSIYQKKGFDYKKIAIIAVVVIVIILLAVSLFYLLKPGKKETKPEMTLKVELTKKELMPGDTLKFNVDISSSGVKRYILNIENSILYKKNVISKSSEKIQFSKRSLTQQSLELHDKLKPGDYELEVKIYYDNKVKTATSAFRIKGETAEEETTPEEGLEKECPLSCDDSNDCTEDSCGEETGFKCSNTLIIPCCGNNLCEGGETERNCETDCKKDKEVKIKGEEAFEGLTIWEKIREIGNISITNLKFSEEFCKGVKQETYKDQCFLNIAEARKDITYCENIINNRTNGNCYLAIAQSTKDSQLCAKIIITRRDYCYMSFVKEEDYSVCPRLNNKYLRQSCNTLSNINSKE
ncbi:hypothetical protein CMO89_00785 [Candidatus Woesearchaeota archaeon]|nr:hypothetical protein [Candidatus Woesearchaeota archaeon]|tara:strand:+ start:8678 stop:9856 length:1179 start_codon:yes stop_codon:yes gene_type:complete